jgi:hypothetical protein
VLLNLIERYQDLIKSWSIIEHDRAGLNFRFKARITFYDGSVLFVRQVVLGESIFKYAYHWQNREGDLIYRWDNSPHWQGISTYPHHKHVSSAEEATVMESQGGDLDEIFKEIAEQLAAR